MNNIHGQRINMDIPVREGSGFVGKHGADFINFNDRWSQIINLLTGPDGSVFMIDWYDKNQCHHNEINGHDRSNGRIFKIAYNDAKSTPVDLQKLSSEDLIKLQTHQNDWFSRHARRILQERLQGKPVAPAVLASLNSMIDGEKNSIHRLRALWSVHVTAGLSEENALSLLHKETDEFIRSWVIQILSENQNPSDALLREFARLAREDKSPVVRLYLASACQRLSIAQRLPILEALLAHDEDAGDHNLPLMYWYAAEPVAGEGSTRAVSLLAKAKIPQVRQFITRRMSASSTEKRTADAKVR